MSSKAVAALRRGRGQRQACQGTKVRGPGENRGAGKGFKDPFQMAQEPEEAQSSETSGTVVVSNPLYNSLTQVREGNLF